MPDRIPLITVNGVYTSWFVTLALARAMRERIRADYPGARRARIIHCRKGYRLRVEFRDEHDDDQNEEQ